MIDGHWDLRRKRNRGNHEYRQLYIPKQQGVERLVQGRTL
jgi:hypothetical protein